MPLDQNIIKKTAATLSVPVIANGSIYTGLDAQKMIQKTGAAAVMPGRGLLGNPWIIPEILNTLSDQEIYATPAPAEERSLSETSCVTCGFLW